MLSAGGGCELVVTCDYLCGNGLSLEEVQGAATSSHIPPSLTRPMTMNTALACRVPSSMPSSMPLTKMNLQRNDRAKIRQICSIKLEDLAMVRSSELLAKLELEDLNLILRERRLHCFGHVERCRGAVRTAFLSQSFVFI